MLSLRLLLGLYHQVFVLYAIATNFILITTIVNCHMMSLSEDDLELQSLPRLLPVLVTPPEPPDHEDQAQAEATHQQHAQADK